MQEITLAKKINETGIKESICYIAGMAYILNHNYKVSDVVLEDTSPLGMYQDNFVIDKRSYKQALRDAKYQKKRERTGRALLSDYIDPVKTIEGIPARCDKRSRENGEYVRKTMNDLRNLGLDVTDNIQKSFETYPVKITYDQHSIRSVVPLITPDYFPSYFPGVFEKYNELSKKAGSLDYSIETCS